MLVDLARPPYCPKRIRRLCEVSSGKMTNPSAPSSQSPGASSPGELLHADIFVVTSDRSTKVPYLITLEDTVNYMMVIKVKSRQSVHLSEAFMRMVSAYKSYGDGPRH